MQLGAGCTLRLRGIPAWLTGAAHGPGSELWIASEIAGSPFQLTRDDLGLAVHCLTAVKPDPVSQLADVAEINQKMFGRDDKDFFYEAWFSEIALAFASAAADRGWVIPTTAVHASMPLELFALRGIQVPEHRWGELLPIDPNLGKAIERAAGGGKKPSKNGRRS